VAGKIIADIIEAPFDSIKMNVANVTVLTANNSGLTYLPTGNVNINIGSTASLTLGNVTVSNLITANGGIRFPATQVSSANANTLDDYEEGTFTYTMPCSTSGSYTVRASYTTGYYTKVGRVVTIALRYESQGSSSPVGDLQISGFPFATASAPSGGTGTYTFPVLLRGSTGTIASFYFEITAGVTVGRFTKQATDGSYSAMTPSDISGGASGNYEGTLLFSYTTS